MKINKIMVASLLLLAVLTLGAVSASDNLTASETPDSLELGVSEADILTDDDVGDEEIGDNQDIDERENVDYEIFVPSSVRAGPSSFYDDEMYDTYATMRLDAEVSGNYSIFVDENEVSNGTAQPWNTVQLNLKNVNLTDYGKHDITFKYSGDGNYRPFNHTGSFEYFYYRVNVPENVTIGEWANSRIRFEFAVDARGTLSIAFDDKLFHNYSVYDVRFYEDEGLSPRFSISLDSLSFGEHTYAIVYSGDENYDGFSINGTLNVADYMFEVYNWATDGGYSIYYGDEVEFCLYLPDDAFENITLIANGREYVIESEGGSTYYQLSNYTVGENNLTFTYVDDKYFEKTVNLTLEVKGNINTDDVGWEIVYNSTENGNFTLLLPSDAKGNLVAYKRGEYDDETGEYKLGDEVKKVALNNGNASLSLSDLALGEHDLIIAYDGDDYDVESQEINVYVIPNVEYPSGIYTGSDEVRNVTVTSPDDAEGSLTIGIYNRVLGEFDEYEVGDLINEIYSGPASGVRTATMPELDIGIYYLRVNYNDSITRTYVIRVDDVDPNWEMDYTFPKRLINTMDENYVYTHVKNIPDDANGKLVLYFDGERRGYFDLTDDYGSLGAYYGNLDYGIHTWELKYTDDTYYNPTSVNGTFEVTWISIPEVIYPGYRVSKEMYGFGEVILYLNGTEYGRQMIEDYYGVTFTLDDLELYETYEYEFVYESEPGKNITATGSFYVTYNFDAYFKDESTYSQFMKSYEFYVNLPEGAYGNVTVIVNNKTYTADVENGSAVVTLTDLDENTDYEAIVQYSGYGDYIAREITVPIYIGDFEVVGKYDGDDLSGVALSLPEDAVGNLTLYINDEIYESVPLEDGYAEIYWGDLPLGYFRLSAYYTGDDYWASSFYPSFSILPEMNITDNIEYGDDCVVEIELPNATGQLEIYVDYELYDTYDVDDGRIVAYISDLDEGEHMLTFNYLGDEYYHLFTSYYYKDEDFEESEPMEFWVYVNEYEAYEVEGVEFYDGNAMDNDIIVKIPKDSIEGLDEVVYAVFDAWDLKFEKNVNLSEIDSDDEFYIIRIADVTDDASAIEEREDRFRIEFFEDGNYRCYAEDEITIYNSPYFSQESSVLYEDPVVTLREIPEDADELTISVFKEGSLIANNTFNIAELRPVSDDWEDYDGDPVYEFTDAQLGITEEGEYNITVDFLKDSTLVKAYSQMVNVSFVNILVCDNDEHDDDGNTIHHPFQFVDEEIFVIKVPESLTGYYVNIYKDDVQLGGDIDISDLIYNDGWGWAAQARAVKLNDLDIDVSGNYTIRLEFYSEDGELLANETNDIEVEIGDDIVKFYDSSYTSWFMDVIEFSLAHKISSDDYFNVYLNGELAGNITPFAFDRYSIDDKFHDCYYDLSEHAKFLKVGHYDVNITFVHDGTEEDFTTGEFNIVRKLDLTTDKDTYLADEDILISFNASEPTYGKLRPYHITGWGEMGYDDGHQIFNTISHDELMDVWEDGVFTINVGEYSDFEAGDNYILIQYEVMESEDDEEGVSYWGLIKVTIIGPDSSINASDIEFDYGKSGSANISLGGATDIIANVVGHEANVTFENGTITVSGLDAGNYTLNITTVPEKGYMAVSKLINITVNKVDSSVSVSDVAFDYGGSGFATVDMAGATGVTAVIVNSTVAPVVDGDKITVSGLDAGTYTLEVTTVPDANHNAITGTAVVTVNKVDSSVGVSDVAFDYGGSGSATVDMAGATGVTAVIVNSAVAPVVDGDKITVSGLDAGTYTLEVTTVPDANHNAITGTAVVTVNKVDSSVGVSDVAFDYGGSGSATVDLTGATGVTAKIVNSAVAPVVDGNKVIVSGLDAGTYTLEVTSVPDANHNPAKATAVVTVNKVNSSVSVSDVAFDYGGSGSATVDVAGATGVTAKIVDSTVKPVVDGNKVTVSGLDAGTYDLEVVTVVDGNHNPATATAIITVNKVNSTVSVSDVAFDYGGSGSATVDLTGATGVTAVIVNSTVAPVVDGNKVTVSGLDAGTYTLEVTSVVDGNHNPATETATITVNKVNSTVSVSDVEFDYGGSGSATVDMTGATGVTAKILDSTVNPVVDGNKITVSGLAAGNYTLEVTTVPDANHNAATATANVVVSTADTVIVVNTAFSRYATDYYSDGTKDGANGERGGFFYATLYDVNGNPLVNKTVQIAINGPVYNVTTDENGKAGLQVNLAKANTYTYALYFPGDEGYSASLIASSKLTVVKKPTSIISNNKYVFKASLKTKTVTVALNTIKNPFDNKLYLKAGKKLTLTVNGKTYTAKTDSKGVAKFNIKLSKIGTFTATVKFAGDSTYEATSKSIKISISKSAGSNAALKGVGVGMTPKELDAPGALNVEGNYADYIAGSNISTSNVNSAKKDAIIVVDSSFTRNATDYSAGERGGFFYASLTDSNGNPLVNKTVQIAVNGPIYNVTTDKDGKAGLQVNLAKANTYTYALSFAGDDEYNPAMLASSKLTVIKKPITIDVKGLSFKAKAKTKTVTVKLSTIKNAYDSKIYLKDNKNVNLKVNGITYSGNIKNGVVTFNVKLTKKGTYAAVVSFDGDSTYESASKRVLIKIKA